MIQISLAVLSKAPCVVYCGKDKKGQPPACQKDGTTQANSWQEMRRFQRPGPEAREAREGVVQEEGLRAHRSRSTAHTKEASAHHQVEKSRQQASVQKTEGRGLQRKKAARFNTLYGVDSSSFSLDVV